MRYRPFPTLAGWAGLDVNEAVYDRYADLLRSAKERADPATLAAAVDRATRLAAVDTGAVEGLYEVDRGFTRTVATEAAAWEALATTRGEQVKSAIYDALEAYEAMRDLATRSERLTEVVIRGLHRVICRGQETYAVHTAAGRQEHPLPRGRYKRFPNNPTSLRTGRVHEYASVADTPAEMHRLVRELSSPEFEAAHPVSQAAYAHYAFVCIHPFADGNGRVSRALASAFLYRSPGVPLLIFADQKDTYIDALEAADGGDPRDFVAFVSDRVIDVIQLVRSFLRTPSGGPAKASVAEFRDLKAKADAGYAEVAAMRELLFALVRREVDKQFAQIELGGIEVRLSESSERFSRLLGVPDAYHEEPGAKRLRVTLSGGPPAAVNRMTMVSALAAAPSFDGPGFLVAASAAGVEPLEVFARELRPIITSVLELKISAWVEHLIDHAVREVVVDTERQLRALGYLGWRAGVPGGAETRNAGTSVGA